MWFISHVKDAIFLTESYASVSLEASGSRAFLVFLYFLTRHTVRNLRVWEVTTTHAAGCSNNWVICDYDVIKGRKLSSTHPLFNMMSQKPFKYYISFIYNILYKYMYITTNKKDLLIQSFIFIFSSCSALFPLTPSHNLTPKYLAHPYPHVLSPFSPSLCLSLSLSLSQPSFMLLFD